MLCLALTLPPRDKEKTTNKNIKNRQGKHYNKSKATVASQSRNMYLRIYNENTHTKVICRQNHFGCVFITFLLLFHVIVYAVNECLVSARTKSHFGPLNIPYICRCIYVAVPRRRLVDCAPHTGIHFVSFHFKWISAVFFGTQRLHISSVLKCTITAVTHEH